jgi:hypothetical protein
LTGKLTEGHAIAAPHRSVNGANTMSIVVEMLFTIIWWIVLSPVLWTVSLPFILLMAVFSQEPFFVAVRSKYTKITKWWAEYGVIFYPF